MLISCYFRPELIFNSIIGKSVFFFKWFLRTKLEDTMRNISYSVPLLRRTPEQAQELPSGSILMKLDRFHRALVHAGPALNTILRPGRI